MVRKRRWTGRAAARALVAVATMAAVTSCSVALRDLGPLPSRSSGPPLPADTVVRELTSAMAAEGVTLERAPEELDVLECHETLSGQHETATAAAALRAGFDRAREDHGWQTGSASSSTMLSLRKGNWTAAATLPDRRSVSSPTTLVVISLLCDGARSKRTTGETP